MHNRCSYETNVSTLLHVSSVFRIYKTTRSRKYYTYYTNKQRHISHILADFVVAVRIFRMVPISPISESPGFLGLKLGTWHEADQIVRSYILPYHFQSQKSWFETPSFQIFNQKGIWDHSLPNMLWMVVQLDLACDKACSARHGPLRIFADDGWVHQITWSSCHDLNDLNDFNTSYMYHWIFHYISWHISSYYI